MNPNNYCTLEAAKRLVEAGIVLDGTDMHWIKERDGSFSLVLSDVHYDGSEEYPAPSMAEVWRELSCQIDSGDCLFWELAMYKVMNGLQVGYICGQRRLRLFIYDENPTDALIDLLIWVRKEHGNGKS